jgi:hypothetical protein
MQESSNQRIEPMTRSAVTLLLQSGAIGALLVMAHPGRSARLWPSGHGKKSQAFANGCIDHGTLWSRVDETNGDPYMKLNMKDPGQVFTGVVVAALLILTAWGNATALLVFSAIGLAVWLVAPSLRGQIPLRRGLLGGVISFVVAVGIASVLILSRGH